jgi:hypothetical protein
MDPLAALARLVALGPRGACSDGERRAASWAREQLRAGGREARFETLWLRPDWPLAYAAHAALAAAGSLLSVWKPAVGLAVLAVAVLSLAGELSGRLRLLRLLWPARATQNVVSPAGEDEVRVRLVVTANVDAGRVGADRLAGRGARPPLLVLLWLACLMLCVLAGLRLDDAGGQAVSIAQFALTVAVIVLFATLVDLAFADRSPGANANASGVALALALAAELDRSPPRALALELVLAGAGDEQALGLERYVRARRRRWPPDRVVLLAIEPCGAGTPVWLEREGTLVPLRMHPRLGELMAHAATREPHLAARAHRAQRTGAAYAARRAGWPAIAVGALDAAGRTPRAHEAGDVPEAIDGQALQATLELCLAFIGLLDAELATSSSP